MAPPSGLVTLELDRPAPAPDPDATAEGYLVATDDGSRIHFVEWRGARSGTGVPVVLVPGLAATTAIWAPVARRLVGERRVIVVDPRGHGLSDAPFEGYEPARLGDDVVTAMDGSGMGGTFVLAGHGYGAILAAVAARILGERCRGLVLVDGGWERLTETLDMDADEFARGLDEPPEVMRTLARYLADRRGFDPQTWDADQEAAARDAVVETAAGHVVRSIRPHALEASVRAMFDYEPLAVLPLVDAPIAVLAARDDTARRREAALREAADAVVRATGRPIRVARYPSDGHNLIRYRPADVAAAISSVAA